MSAEAPWLDAPAVDDAEPWKSAPIVENADAPWESAPIVEDTTKAAPTGSPDRYQERGTSKAREAQVALRSPKVQALMDQRAKDAARGSDVMDVLGLKGSFLDQTPESLAALDVAGPARSGIDAQAASGINPGNISVQPLIDAVTIHPSDTQRIDPSIPTTPGGAENNPVVTFPTPAADTVAAGVARGLGTTASGLTTPENLGLLAAGAGAPAVVQKLAAAGFATAMARELPGQIQAVADSQSPGEAAERITGAVATAAMATLAAKHAGSRSPMTATERATFSSEKAPIVTPAQAAIAPLTAEAVKGEAGLAEAPKVEVPKLAEDGKIAEPKPEPSEPSPGDDNGKSEGPGAASASEDISNTLPPTGLKRAVVDTERLSRGAEPIPTVERQREEGVVRAAEDTVHEDPTVAPTLVSRIVDAGETHISEHEAATLLVERRRVMNERAAWEERLGRGEDVETARTRLGEIETELDRLDRAQRAAGSTWGRTGHMYQRLMADDFSLEAMERKTRAKLERPLTETERETLKTQASKIEELQKQAEEAKTAHESEAIDSDVARMYEATINELGKSYLEKPTFGQKVFDIARNIVDRWKEEAKGLDEEIKRDLGITGESGGIGGAGGGAGGRKLGQGAISNEALITKLAKVIRASVGEFGLSKAEMAADLISRFGEKVRPHIEAAWKSAHSLISSEKTDSKVKEVASRGVKKKGETTPGAVAARAKAEATAGEPLSHKTVYELARAHIKAGVHGEGPVMAAVHADLEKIYPGMTERDVRRAMSEYGKVKFPNQEATAKELSELRTLTRLQESIDRMTEGRDALHSGLQRDKATQAIREKQKQVNELLKKRQGPPSPEKLASRDAAKQTALRNAIEDLDKQLRTGEKPAPGAKVPDSVETERLRAERDAMREKLKEIEDEANPGKSDAEKQVEQLQKVRDRLDEVLAGKRPANAPKDWTPLSEAAADLKAEIQAMHELAAQLRRDAKPIGDKGAIAERQKIQALEKAIARYEKKIADKDFSTKGKKLGPDSARVAELKAIRDARIDAYNAAKKAGKPVRTKEEIYNATRMKEVQKRTAELQSRIAAGDFTRKPKPVAPAKTQAVKDAEFKLAKEKERFNRGLFEVDQANRTLPKKAWDAVFTGLNTARAAMTAFDLSAPLRQGAFITLGHPVRALKAFPAMFKAMLSEKGQFEVNQEIQARPNAELYRASKLHLNDPGSIDLSKLEENYMSRLSQRIPGISHSERAYTTFLNRLRADSFDALADSVAGSRKLTPEEGKAIANFVNVATGRGNLAASAEKAINFNTAFFAPRYVISRFELLAGQPLYRGTAGTRLAVAKEYGRFLAGLGTVYALAQLAGATVEKDPRSSEFGKMKFGNTRVDPLAGLSQATVLASRVFTGKSKAANGIQSLRGDDVKFGQPDTSGTIGRFLRTKLSPAIGTVIDVSSGKDVAGNAVTPGSAALRLVVPLSFGDIYNAMRDQGVAKGTALSILAFFGMGVQTYGDRSANKVGSK